MVDNPEAMVRLTVASIALLAGLSVSACATSGGGIPAPFPRPGGAARGTTPGLPSAALEFLAGQVDAAAHELLEYGPGPGRG